MGFQGCLRHGEGVRIIDLNGRITLGEGTDALRELLLLALEQTPNLILNLAGVSYMDSSGIGEMVRAYTASRRRGGKVTLLQPQKRLHNMLQLTQLSTLFEAYDDETQAVRSFIATAIT